MSKHLIIYKAEYENHVYVGQTSRELKDRQYLHHHSAFKYNSQGHFHRALRKYGWDSFNWEILEEHDNPLDANMAEIRWIEYYKKQSDITSLNMTDGGEGRGSGFFVSEETRKKISQSRIGKEPWNKGKKMSEESRKKMSESAKTKIFTEEHRKKMSESGKGKHGYWTGKSHEGWNKGMKHTDETKCKIGKAHKNRKHSKEHVEHWKESMRLARLRKLSVKV